MQKFPQSYALLYWSIDFPLQKKNYLQSTVSGTCFMHCVVFSNCIDYLQLPTHKKTRIASAVPVKVGYYNLLDLLLQFSGKMCNRLIVFTNKTTFFSFSTPQLHKDFAQSCNPSCENEGLPVDSLWCWRAEGPNLGISMIIAYWLSVRWD